MDNSAIICDEVIDVDADAEAKLHEEAKIIPRNFSEQKVTCKMQNF